MTKKKLYPQYPRYKVFDSKDKDTAYSVAMRTEKGWKDIASFPISLHSDVNVPFCSARMKASDFARTMEAKP